MTCQGDLQDQPLAGVTVLELATGIAGPYMGKLFADYGADVIKIEPPGGDERGDGDRFSPKFPMMTPAPFSSTSMPTSGRRPSTWPTRAARTSSGGWS